MTQKEPTPAGETPATDLQPDVVIRAELRTSGEVLPAPLREAVFGGPNNAPEFAIEAAEGVTTFEGFNGKNRRPDAEEWLDEQFEHIAKTYPAAAAPAGEKKSSSGSVAGKAYRRWRGEPKP